MTESKLGADYCVNPKKLKNFIKDMVAIQQPALVLGQPGSAKSSIMKQVAEETGREYIDIRPLLLNPVELHGLPRFDGEVTRWSRPYFFPTPGSDKRYLINIEELPAAPPLIQTALYQLMLDRRCGEYVLPEGASVMACGNREVDRGVFNRMAPALRSRMVHYEIKIISDDWIEWALQNEIAPEIIYAVSYNHELLNTYNPDSRELTFSCPRTLEFLSDYVNHLRDEERIEDVSISTVVGTVGEIAGVEIYSFLKLFKELPDPEDVFRNPMAVDIPQNISALYMLCSALTRKATTDNMDKIILFAGRLRPEIGEFMVDSCTRRNVDLKRTRAWVEWESERSK